MVAANSRLLVSFGPNIYTYGLDVDDRLVDLLKHFELQPRVFQSGPLCHSAQYDTEEGLGYIHVLHSGSITLESSEYATQAITEPSLILYLKPAQHRLQPSTDKPFLVCASFRFGTGLSNPIIRALPELISLKLNDIELLEPVLSIMFKEAQEMHCGRQGVLDRLMEVVFIQILRYLMDEHTIELGLVAGLADRRLSKSINAIHKYPSAPWTLSKLAATSGMSRARYAEHFRDVVGMTPGAYLTEWRINIAQNLLRAGTPIQWVADQVGYASASAFSRAFKAQLGMSPSEWNQTFSDVEEKQR